MNRNGNWYSPYGETRAAYDGAITNDNSIRYVSGYYDTTAGLYRLGARNYDPSLGRFTQRDPSGQESNRYSYAGCNPINAKDPSGLAEFNWACGLAVLAAVGTSVLLAGEILAAVLAFAEPEPVVTKAAGVAIALRIGGSAIAVTASVGAIFVTC